MKTQTLSRISWLSYFNLWIAILVFVITLMMLANMSSNFYKIFYALLPENIALSIIRGISWLGVYYTLPVGIFNIAAGHLFKRGSGALEHRRMYTLANAGITMGILNVVIGAPLMVFFLFFVTF